MAHTWNRILKLTRTTSLLTAEEERMLFERYKKNGDRKALDELIMSQSRLILREIVNIFGRRIIYDDERCSEYFNVSIAEIARIIDRFNPDKGRLINITRWWIRHAILKQLHDESTIRGMSFSRVQSIKRETGHQTDIKKIFPSICSFDTVVYDKSSASPAGEGSAIFGMTLKDKLVSVEDLSDEEVGKKERAAFLRTAITTLLTAREQVIITERIFTDSDDKITHKKLGKRFGVSGERIRQCEAQALKKLKKYIRHYYPDYSRNFCTAS